MRREIIKVGGLEEGDVLGVKWRKYGKEKWGLIMLNDLRVKYGRG